MDNGRNSIRTSFISRNVSEYSDFDEIYPPFLISWEDRIIKYYRQYRKYKIKIIILKLLIGLVLFLLPLGIFQHRFFDAINHFDNFQLTSSLSYLLLSNICILFYIFAIFIWKILSLLHHP
jgi:hypothetical protein